MVPTVVPWQKKEMSLRCRALIDELFDAVQYRLKRFLRSRRDLGDADLAGVFVEENKIGECSSGVDCDSILGHRVWLYH